LLDVKGYASNGAHNLEVGQLLNLLFFFLLLMMMQGAIKFVIATDLVSGHQQKP